LRLDPPRGDIPELRLWPETLSNLDRPEDDPPLLEFLDTRQDNQLQVINISASGLLLNIRPPLPEVLKTELEKGKRFYISLTLLDPGQTSIQTFQLLTQVRNVFFDPDQGQRFVGLSFAAHLTRTEGSMQWKPLNGKGVEEIEDWVFKRHLQIYREKGLI
jgi:c-di-GMP-binding flagellar brake protein YcgR